MDHLEWTKRFAEALACEPVETVEKLRDLEVETEEASKNGVNHWHCRQLRGVLASSLLLTCRQAEASDVFSRIGDSIVEELVSLQVEAADVFANAALIQLELGNEDAAIQLAQKALSFGTIEIDTSSLLVRTAEFLRERGL